MRRKKGGGPRQDYYFRKAKAENYRARSVYKLQEMDRRFRLLRRGQRILDLGAAPGSWAQYSAERVGPSGKVVAVDRKPLSGPMPPQVRTVKQNVLDLPPEALVDALGVSRVDVVLSDMAPDTSGHRDVDHFRSMTLCRAAFDIAEVVLADGGAWVCKAFQGPDLDGFVETIRRRFQTFRRVKPQSSRRASVEIFLVGLGFQRRDGNAGEPATGGASRDAGLPE